MYAIFLFGNVNSSPEGWSGSRMLLEGLLKLSDWCPLTSVQPCGGLAFGGLPGTHPLSPQKGRGGNNMKKKVSWVAIQTGKSFTSYHHRQNTLSAHGPPFSPWAAWIPPTHLRSWGLGHHAAVPLCHSVLVTLVPCSSVAAVLSLQLLHDNPAPAPAPLRSPLLVSPPQAQGNKRLPCHLQRPTVFSQLSAHWAALHTCHCQWRVFPFLK